jgi:hypothetical protein
MPSAKKSSNYTNHISLSTVAGLIGDLESKGGRTSGNADLQFQPKMIFNLLLTRSVDSHEILQEFNKGENENLTLLQRSQL